MGDGRLRELRLKENYRWTKCFIDPYILRKKTRDFPFKKFQSLVLARNATVIAKPYYPFFVRLLKYSIKVVQDKKLSAFSDTTSSDVWESSYSKWRQDRRANYNGDCLSRDNFKSYPGRSGTIEQIERISTFHDPRYQFYSKICCFFWRKLNLKARKYRFYA